MANYPVYKVIFQNGNQVFEVFAQQIYQSDMWGFIEVEEFLFGERSQIISAENNSASKYFIESAKLNDKIFNHNYLNYQSIQNGGELIFKMAEQPNMKWGSQAQDLPYSFSNVKTSKVIKP